MKQKDDMLKMLARQAKNRLRGGSNLSGVEYKRNFKVIYNDSETIKNVIISNKEDENLYKKVVGLLDSNEEINVVSHIIDKKYMNSLDEMAKQRYFLTMLDKYRKFKQRYEAEKHKDVAGI